MKKNKLINAIERGDARIVQSLLNSGEDARTRDSEGIPAISIAAGTGLSEIVDLLLLHKADINQQDSNGYVPLHYAILERKNKMVKHLINKGASVDRTVDGLPIVHYAVQHKNPIALKILLKLDGIASQINLPDSDGCLPIHWAAQVNCIKCIEILSKYNCDMNAYDKSGQTALHIAASFGKEKCVSKLLALGADKNLLSRGSDKCLPYDLASTYGNTKVASLL